MKTEVKRACNAAVERALGPVLNDVLTNSTAPASASRNGETVGPYATFADGTRVTTQAMHAAFKAYKEAVMRGENDEAARVVAAAASKSVRDALMPPLRVSKTQIARLLLHAAKGEQFLCHEGDREAAFSLKFGVAPTSNLSPANVTLQILPGPHPPPAIAARRGPRRRGCFECHGTAASRGINERLNDRRQGTTCVVWRLS